METSTDLDPHRSRVPEIEVTQRIRETLEKAVACQCIRQDVKTTCDDILEKLDQSSMTKVPVVISVKTVREVYNTLRSEGHKTFLHEIVEDASIIPQSVQLPPRNPELEERIQKLKREAENREYIRMTRNVDPRNKKTFTFNEEVKSMNRHTINILNFLITVAAGFAFGYKGVELVVGKVFPMQMLSGLILGTVVFFVDLYFMLKYGPI
ncbi:transmembrane protein 199 [Aplysia californica]|uniref:Transmembrane protein 199 n=1 Tax=Aplysia californica TaxID=6500 RepID=A0ABM0JSF4_APLCA|nr:transmembrane protein 199 [Aplysia californica]